MRCNTSYCNTPLQYCTQKVVQYCSGVTPVMRYSQHWSRGSDGVLRRLFASVGSFKLQLRGQTRSNKSDWPAWTWLTEGSSTHICQTLSTSSLAHGNKSKSKGFQKKVFFTHVGHRSQVVTTASALIKNVNMLFLRSTPPTTFEVPPASLEGHELSASFSYGGCWAWDLTAGSNNL